MDIKEESWLIILIDLLWKLEFFWYTMKLKLFWLMGIESSFTLHLFYDIWHISMYKSTKKVRILIWVYVNFQWFKKLSYNLTLRRLIWELIIVWLYCHLQMSNGDMYEKNHDELDFEFLGNIRGKEWRVQTNVYGNGSTSVGREERYTLWFDPTEEFHCYSILWTEDQIM